MEQAEVDRLRRSLASCVLSLDGASARAALAEALATDVDHTVAEVVLPVWSEVQAACERGDLTAMHAHVLAQAVRSGVCVVPPPPRGRARGTVVTACLPGERDDLVLEVIGVLMRGRRWRTVALGADTPLSAVAEGYLLTRAHAVVLAGASQTSFVVRAARLRRLGRYVPTFLAGAGTRGLEPVPENTIVLPQPPTSAVRLLDAFGNDTP